MEIKIKSYSSQSSLISSIIFFILGAILFTSADKIIETISIIAGILLGTSSIISLTIYAFQIKKQTPNTGNLIFGIISLIFAIIFIFFSEIVEQGIRFIIGAWILFTGIIRLINVLSMNKNNNKFIQLLIVAILLIMVGIYTIVIGDVILSTIGIIMMIYAAIEIVGYILYSKDKVEPEETGATTLIVPETTEIQEKNNKNIKDIKEKKQRKNKKDKEK